MIGESNCPKCGGLGRLVKSDIDNAFYECYDITCTSIRTIRTTWIAKRRTKDSYDITAAIADVGGIFKDMEEAYDWGGDESDGILTRGYIDISKHKEEVVEILRRLAG